HRQHLLLRRAGGAVIRPERRSRIRKAPDNDTVTPDAQHRGAGPRRAYVTPAAHSTRSVAALPKAASSARAAAGASVAFAGAVAWKTFVSSTLPSAIMRAANSTSATGVGSAAIRKLRISIISWR